MSVSLRSGMDPVIAASRHLLRERHYDLPLHRGSGGALLMWTIGVMTYLICLFMMMVFMLAAVQSHWQQGMEGRYTIEIPYDTVKMPTSASQMTKLVDDLNKIKGVKAALLSDDDMSELVEPWLGGNAAAADLPLPGLISVERDATRDDSAAMVADIKAVIQRDLPSARLDTHQEWLAKWVQLTRTGRMIILTIALILVMTAALTVAGTAKTRLALHREEVDLLHLIGATDHYIATQFQRQAFRIAAEGAGAGMICALATLGLVSVIKGQTPSQLLPHFAMNWMQWCFLLVTPLLSGLIAMLASRFTVINALEELP